MKNSNPSPKSDRSVSLIYQWPRVRILADLKMFGKKADLAEKSQTMTDWRTHHQGQRVFCFCVIFRVCLISKITKESHSKMENLHRRCLKVHHSKLLQSFTSPSSPHCKLTLITDLAKFRGWLFFLPRARVNLKLIFLLTTGLVKFTVECLLTERARRRRHIFEKSQQNLSFQMVSIVKWNFKVGLSYYIFLFEFIFISFFLTFVKIPK